MIELAREHTEEAIAALREIMLDPKAQGMARVRAAEIILSRGWGSPVTEADLPLLLDNGPIRIVFNLGEEREVVEIEDAEFAEELS